MCAGCVRTGGRGAVEDDLVRAACFWAWCVLFLSAACVCVFRFGGHQWDAGVAAGALALRVGVLLDSRLNSSVWAGLG